ncbi:hypothetical protein THAOC_19737, partial [Thalassiosira oceanica]
GGRWARLLWTRAGTGTPGLPSSFVSAPSPGGDVLPRADQRHSLLTSSATPTTVRPPPFPDALAARGEVDWLRVWPGRVGWNEG